MKREELEVKDFLTHPLCEVKEHYYRKSDADKVMDAMEARIKELEDSYKYFKSQNGFHIQQSNELAESCRDKNKLIETLLQRIDELEDKVQMHDFFWEGCSLSKRGFTNTIDVANYIKELEEKLAMKLDPALYPNCNDCECCKHPASTQQPPKSED